MLADMRSDNSQQPGTPLMSDNRSATNEVKEVRQGAIQMRPMGGKPDFKAAADKTGGFFIPPFKPS